MPRSQQQHEVLPSGRYMYRMSPSAISWRPLLATKLRPGTHRPTPPSGVYIQPRVLCSRAEGITDYRLRTTDYRLQITGHQDGITCCSVSGACGFQ